MTNLMLDINQDKKDLVIWDHCPRCGFLNHLENTSIVYGNNLSSPVEIGFGTDCWLCGTRLKGHRHAHLCIKMNIKPQKELDDLLDSLSLAYKQLEEQERESIEVVSLGGERRTISMYPRNHSKSKRILDMMNQVHLASNINLDKTLFLTREQNKKKLLGDIQYQQKEFMDYYLAGLDLAERESIDHAVAGWDYIGDDWDGVDVEKDIREARERLGVHPVFYIPPFKPKDKDRRK